MNVGDLKKFIEDNNIPDGAMVVLSVDPAAGGEESEWCEGGNELDGMLSGYANHRDLSSESTQDAEESLERAMFLFPAR